MKKLLISLLCVVVFVSLMAIGASAAEANVNGTEYDTLAAAIAAAGDGDTVTLTSNVSVDTQIVLDKNLTLELDGKTITNNVQDGYLIEVSADIDLVINGGSMTIPATNTAAYGFVNLVADGASIKVTDATLSGDVAGKGAKYSYFNCYISDAVGAAGCDFTLINVNTVDNNYRVIYTHEVANMVTVEGGNYAGDHCSFVVCTSAVTEDGYNSVFRNVTASAAGGPIVEVIGYPNGQTHTLFEDCTFSATGADNPAAPPTSIAVSFNGNVTIDGGTYSGSTSASAKDAVSVYSTGGTVNIKDGTFNGNIHVIAQSGSYGVNVSGGTINGTIEETKYGNVTVAGSVTGGTFTEEIPEEYYPDGYIPVDNGDGTFNVTAGEAGAGAGDKIISVDGVYVSHEASLVVSVDLTWTAATFKYTESKTWDDQKHVDYVSSRTWSGDPMKITVSNHSNQKVATGFEFASAALSTNITSTITGVFTVAEETTEAATASVTLDAATEGVTPSNYVNFKVTGGSTYSTSSDSFKLGDITVTISGAGN